MINKVNFISKAQAEKLLQETNGAFIATIDGKNINSWTEYWNTISTVFSFPDLPEYMKPDYHSYYDLMTDLSWIENRNIMLIIDNANDFFKNNLSLKNDIIKDFNEYLLPFWEKEIEYTQVNGQTKIFNVYLIV